MFLYVILFAVGLGAIMWLINGAINVAVEKTIISVLNKTLLSYSKFQTEKLESFMHLVIMFRRMTDDEFEAVIGNMGDVDKVIEGLVKDTSNINKTK